ncbi:glycosyltransferase family 4 protein [Vibrio cholerae]|uniref:WblR protein n=1 Tax=Vibrio cholerae TaxID=666 RepID=D6NLZ8_VIBCL|nr:glycosyltransferase [Vibrio cholerae]ADF80983.1 WblR protein [Vibrio cholerae]EGQ7881104.1 glycosyltransferase [Vibrio cholerae]EGQ9321836.1 glycosyltransferase [Vibrio cholerae]EGQ9436449.1 glycosyltransferase [Vibrio cholerae]EGQ9634395.1 glycosyltransferase [Vibrio cholerae]
MLDEIIFFYPSYTLGGVQTLFIRTLNKLAKEGIRVGYCDFHDGTLRKSLKDNSEISYVTLDDIRNIKSNLIVTSANYMNVSKLIFHRDSKLLFWFLSPYNLPILNLSQKTNIDFKSINIIDWMYNGFENIDYLLKKESVYFMDKLCFEINGSPEVNYDSFLPLYIDMPEFDASFGEDSNCLNIAWIGRIDLSVKYHCVVYLIEEFEKIKKCNKFKYVTLTIVGSGAGSEDIKKMCKNLTCCDYINFIDNVEYSRFHKFIASSFDVVFAHGTTCLESASVGVPTVCLDGSINKMREGYRFKWLFKRPSYDIGRTEFDEDFSNIGSNLHDILLDVIHRRSEISIKCKNVVLNSFDSSEVINKIRHAFTKANASTRDVKLNWFTFFVDLIVCRVVLSKIFKIRLISLITKLNQK